MQYEDDLDDMSNYKAKLIKRPSRGITELSKLGKNVNPNNTKYIHDLVMKGWKI